MYFKQSASSSDYDLYHDEALPAPSAQKGPLGPKVRVPPPDGHKNSPFPGQAHRQSSIVHIRIPFPGQAHCRSPKRTYTSPFPWP